MNGRGRAVVWLVLLPGAIGAPPPVAALDSGAGPGINEPYRDRLRENYFLRLARCD